MLGLRSRRFRCRGIERADAMSYKIFTLKPVFAILFIPCKTLVTVTAECTCTKFSLSVIYWCAWFLWVRRENMLKSVKVLCHHKLFRVKSCKLRGTLKQIVSTDFFFSLGFMVLLRFVIGQVPLIYYHWWRNYFARSSKIHNSLGSNRNRD